MYYSIQVAETGAELKRLTTFDDAVQILQKYEDEDREYECYEEDFYDIKQVLDDMDIINLKCLIRNEFYKMYTDLKAFDIDIIESYEPCEYKARILVVDKFHTPMYYKFEVIINDDVELIGMELYNKVVLA